MKTTITVSVRDGWLSFKTESGDDSLRCFRVDTIIAVHDLSMWRSEYGVLLVTAARSGDEVAGIRAAEVMELIHAGKGEIRREVGP
jgi:hypothetical protein